MDKKKIITRLLTGCAFGFTTIGCIAHGGLALTILIMLVIFLATKEYVLILENKGFYPSLKIILFVDVLFSLLAYFNKISLLPVTLTIGCVMTFICMLYKGKQPYIANVASTILGFIYSGLFPLYMLFIRDIGSTPQFHYFVKSSSDAEGLGYLFMLFFCVVFTDTGCYYFGSKFGKNKLAPVISPNKTIEGAVSGVICSIVTALIIGQMIDVAWYHCLVVGILSSFFAQIGDLCESLIKRDAGVKDSGSMLPGHGGFLDRTDSFVFSLPVMYYYFQYFVYDANTTNNLLSMFKGLV